MRRRGPGRWKWAGLVATVAIALTWLMSGWFIAAIGHSTSSETRHLMLTSGSVGFQKLSFTAQRLGLQLTWPSLNPVSARPLWIWWPNHRAMQSYWFVLIPLWIPLILIAIPTGWLWLRGRARVPGMCPRCGYDLAGIPSGICPECGEPSPFSHERADEAPDGASSA